MPEWHESADHSGRVEFLDWAPIGEEWQGPDQGGPALESEYVDIQDVERVHVHYVSDDGSEKWWVMYGPWEDDESFYAFIEYDLDYYGMT